MSQLGLLDPAPAAAEPAVTSGLRFRMNCIPPKTTHQHKKIIRLKTKDGRQFNKLGDRSELVDAKAMLDELLLKHQPSAPLVGPYSLTLEFTWPWRSSETKRNRARGRMPHTSKPDGSNLAKTFEDRLVALRFIEDDASVVDLRVTKWWGNEPGILVQVSTFTEETAHAAAR